MMHTWPPPEARFKAQLDTLQRKDLFRRLRAPEGLDVSSNDYLGLARDARLRDAMLRPLNAGIGSGSTGSRLLTGERWELETVECRFAQWQGQEAALFFNSGYQANLGLLSSVIQAGDHVISDRLNHASLIDGIRLSRGQVSIVPHLDLAAMEQALNQASGPHWIIVESLYSMDGDLAPLGEMANLAAHYGAGLIVDEAHATGLYGPEGQGRVAALGLQDAVTATAHTCGKAMGLAGAFVACSEDLRSLLINRARSFIYSTAPLPVLAPALAASIDILRSEPQRRDRPLHLANRLREALKDGGVETGGDSAIVSLVLGSSRRAVEIAGALQGRGYDVRAIRPPTVPDGTARLRLVTGAHLLDEQIDQLAADILSTLESEP